MAADGSTPFDARVSRVLPHNLDAEQALLGAILVDNEVYNRVGDDVLPDHFYDPVHGRIFTELRRMIAAGKLADGVTLHDLFAKDGSLTDIGGAAYLAILVDAAALPGAAQEYAHIVIDLALRRELIRLGADILEQAHKPSVELVGREQIEAAEKELYALAEKGSSKGGFIAFNEAMSVSINMAEAAFQREGKLSGISTGLDELDHLLGGLHKSDLIILAGRPSMGKTALATNIAFNVAKRCKRERQADGTMKSVEGGVVGFFSLEMSSEQLATRLLADFTGVPSDRVRRGDIQKADYEKLVDALTALNQLPLYIDDTGGITISALTARARRLQRVHGLDLIVVDYLQLVTASGSKRTDGRVQEVSEITMGLKTLAKELNVPVIALSQLSRQVENREDKRPQLSDLRESGSIEQDADVVMFVYREAYYLERMEPDPSSEKHPEWVDKVNSLRRQAEVIVGKQRHGPIGKRVLGFQAELTKFTNLDNSGRYEQPEY